MNIVYLTNTFTPHVGGVARSIEAFSSKLRARGHSVLVVAPEYPDMTPEHDLIRVAAIQNFNASDFSVVLPVPKGLTEELTNFEANIIHSHHPFLLGMTAVRLARSLDLPLVFTHHTLYEQYIHYVAPENEVIATFIIELATAYANLADHVIAPSDSLRQIIQDRGVTSPISVVSTGVEVANFSKANGAAFRKENAIAPQAFVVGHVGRLAPEKNVEFLAHAVCAFLSQQENAMFLLVGDGPCATQIQQIFSERGLANRLVCTGTLEGPALAAAFNAMDVFAFSSLSETQGMVITEAMAAGIPVVALDGPGVRDVVCDGQNGRLLPAASEEEFQSALGQVRALSKERRQQLVTGARATADALSLDRSVDSLVTIYESLCHPALPKVANEDPSGLETLMGRLKAEWEIFKSVTHAGDEALSGTFSLAAENDGDNLIEER